MKKQDEIVSTSAPQTEQPTRSSGIWIAVITFVLLGLIIAVEMLRSNG